MAVLPPGFRFIPRDDELIYYLNKRIEDEPIPHNEIRDAKVYGDNPTDLVKKIFPGEGNENYYFFSPRDRKYKNGSRPDRKAGHGFWKASGKDKEIRSGGKVVGYKKVLVYLKGLNPKFGAKTNWIMHEYTVGKPKKPVSNDSGMRLDDFVLCRIYERLTRKSDKRQEPSNNQAVDDQDTEEGHSTTNTYSAALEQMPAAYHNDSYLVGNDHTTSLINYQAPEQKPAAYHANSSEHLLMGGNNHTASLINYQAAPEQKPAAYHANSTSGHLFVGNNHTTSLINYQAQEQMAPAAYHANSSEHFFVGNNCPTSFINYQAQEQTPGPGVAYHGGAYEQPWAGNGNGNGSTSAPINYYGENKDAIINFGDRFGTFNNDHQKYRGAMRNESVTSAPAAMWCETTAMSSEILPPNCDIFQSHPNENSLIEDFPQTRMIPLDCLFPGEESRAKICPKFKPEQ